VVFVTATSPGLSKGEMKQPIHPNHTDIILIINSTNEQAQFYLYFLLSFGEAGRGGC